MPLLKAQTPAMGSELHHPMKIPAGNHSGGDGENFQPVQAFGFSVEDGAGGTTTGSG